ncbi:MAG: potassium channel protein [Bacteroidetes bacterium]|nr:potassium channel protein [Bacteroidota bacterium]
MVVQSTLKQLRLGIVALLTTICIGTFGYMIIEDMNMFESFYMTMITISTTGFQEVHELSRTGRVLTIFLIITGFAGIAYTGGRGVQLLIETQIFRRRRMSKKLENSQQHYIVCGYGRMGVQICDALHEAKIPFVIVEKDSITVEKILERGYLFVYGDASSDETLLEANIKNAKGLVSVIGTDAENVFTTLSARELNPNLFIVVRAIEEGTESKLMKAGANRVVKPYELGGSRMVQLLLRPGVIDFIEGIARREDIDIHLEELKVHEHSPLVGKTLADSPIRKELNILVVAIIKESNEFIYNPTGSCKIDKGDKLIVIGKSENLPKLNDLCAID